MKICSSCGREELTAASQNSGRDLCPAAFLSSLGVHIDVGSCLKLANDRLRARVHLLERNIVEMWHEVSASDKPLWHYLGMTDEEYKAWVTHVEAEVL